MIVLNRKPLSLIEVKNYVEKVDLSDKKPIHDYLKKFCKIRADKTKKISEDIRGLNNPKIKEENIVKIIDFAPEDIEDINKIFTDVTLTEEEAKVILEIAKKH